MNHLTTIFGIISLLIITSGTLTSQAFGQTTSNVDIQAGSGSSVNSTCVNTHDCFSPNPLEIPAGTTVTWKNTDLTTHTVTSVNNICNGPHVTIQVATDTRQVDPTVMIRTSLTQTIYAKLAQDQPYAEENVNADVRRLVYEAYVSPATKSFEIVAMEGIGHNIFSVQKTVQAEGCSVGSIFDSETIQPGKTFEFRFSNSGTYNYFCTIHPWMIGQVIVGGTTSTQYSNATQYPVIDMSQKTSAIPEFGPVTTIVFLVSMIAIIFTVKSANRSWF
ncbi:MAG TPA: plastocyanin/azurin family copper-binding protein [Candidatus Nitrosotalea sp.]|nr:plastocyanin/azurin family copper-binding protein [Candidatus Nitrosotalea sp.]